MIDGQKAYTLFQAGRSWREVALTLGCEVNPATCAARKWALNSGAPWPLKNKKRPMQAETRSMRPSRGNAVVKARIAYDAAQGGATWAQVAVQVGYSSDRVALNQVRKIALSQGWNWPLGKSQQRAEHRESPQ